MRAHEWHAAAKSRTCWKKKPNNVTDFPPFDNDETAVALQMARTEMTYPTALNSACFVKTSVFVHEHNIFHVSKGWA